MVCLTASHNSKEARTTDIGYTRYQIYVYLRVLCAGEGFSSAAAAAPVAAVQMFDGGHHQPQLLLLLLLLFVELLLLRAAGGMDRGVVLRGSDLGTIHGVEGAFAAAVAAGCCCDCCCGCCCGCGGGDHCCLVLCLPAPALAAAFTADGAGGVMWELDFNSVPRQGRH